ncbi:MAG: tRNA guanosine(15) transglycosylase TgtA [Candidatus Bathyarchaeota archaeon]|jgi:7-cyano-7-deazaguanine tRNA-ribosyltransferase|nr:tRNA guanosine(15) transglycosylase TgtA [Candidatus Bathyarchaeota archaeon A05DMB-3]MDH7607692.1 tRNA guanosine(15) transglycosylase TgtA [Candidatus Bathyarchaeota archaeon]
MMNFEIKERDLLARIGKLRTKSGTVETPLLFPVVNPAIQPIPPKRIRKEFGFEALITNAYILMKRFQNQPAEKGLHEFLGFKGVLMTDSGAYQILVYGDIKTTPKEIVDYQERIDTDIATILDWPTGWKTPRKHAEHTVNETLKRAEELFKIKTREDILWVGPVQGGRYLDLVAKSASEMGALPFHIHALGSPTEVMENYRFDVLVDMILTAKMNLPVERPLHLFGAGHPFMFSLAVALGCDFFDSAAYAIYARANRYMTETGTVRLEELEYFPCACPKCTKTTPKEVAEMPQNERQVFLAEHNLYMCISEIKRIKQAIRDGRLWEHLEFRAHGHPALFQALKKLKRYEDFIEKHSPIVKRSGLFFFGSVGLSRPEVVRHRIRLYERFTISQNAKILVLMPQTIGKPFHKSKEYKKLSKILHSVLRGKQNGVQVCFYEAPFGVVPVELDEVYPLSQHESALPPDEETVEYVAVQVANYISCGRYKTVLLFHNSENWNTKVLEACRRVCSEKRVVFKFFDVKEEWAEAFSRFLKEKKLKNDG